jgi:preprotein translocase subunit YajC
MGNLGGRMNRLLKIGLIAGIIIGILALVGGCSYLAPTATTNADGTPVEQTFWSQYGIFFFLIAIFALFYFVMIRPQRKRQKAQQQMMSNLQRGDKVMTIGGIYGTIDSINEDSIVLKVEGGTTMRVARNAVNLRKEETSNISDSTKK